MFASRNYISYSLQTNLEARRKSLESNSEDTEMAKCVSKTNLEERLFEYKHDIFDKDYGILLPTSFEFTTKEGNDFNYIWRIKYFSDSIDADEFSDGYRVDFSISSIRIETREKLIVGDVAYVTVIVNGQKACDTIEFDSKSPFSTEQILSQEAWIPNDISSENNNSHYIKIIIKFYRLCDDGPNYNQMAEDYTKFLESKSLSDVTFVFGEKKIQAHRQILSARNSVFRSMFESDMIEKKNGIVNVTDIEPNIFQHLLKFIYTENITATDLYDWLKLIVAADKYAVTSLVSICEERILNNLTIESIIDVFSTVNLVKAEALKIKCVEFIVKNKRNVVDTEAYKNLIVSRPDLGTEILSYFLEKL